MEVGRVVRVRRIAPRPEILVAIGGAILFVAAYPFVPAIHQFMLGPSESEMILGLVLFLAVFAVLGPIVSRTLHVDAERRGAIEGGLENAEETKSEARQLLEELRINISEAHLEAARIREMLANAGLGLSRRRANRRSWMRAGSLKMRLTRFRNLVPIL